MIRDTFSSAPEARKYLAAQGYVPTTPGELEGAVAWRKPKEDGYYLVAKTTDGARLYFYTGKPVALPPNSIVTTQEKPP